MMKRASADVINGWQDGKEYPGVIFVQAESALVVSGEDQGQTVYVITLEALKPEPHYLVERQNGTSFIAKQSQLKKLNT